MMLPLRFRVVLLICIFVSAFAVYLIIRNSKQKVEYDSISGKITYLEETYEDLPFRDLGKYRYLTIENYPFPFEMYADDQSKRIDSLSVGDNVTLYFYETQNTREVGVNRFLQFMDKDGRTYFESNNVEVIFGYIIIGICALLSLFCYFMWKAKKIGF